MEQPPSVAAMFSPSAARAAKGGGKKRSAHVLEVEAVAVVSPPIQLSRAKRARLSAAAAILEEPELPEADTGHLSAALRSKYRILEEIGKGAYGKVFRAKKRHGLLDQTQYAIKSIKQSDKSEEVVTTHGNFSPRTMMGLSVGTMTELSLLARLKHPNIVHMEEAMYDATHHTIEMVLELAETDLAKQLRVWWELENPPQENIQHLIRVAYEIFCGLHYLHENGILHLDIKPGNVLIVRGRAKLADFGLSEREEGMRESGEGKVTWPYRSPELQCNLGRYDSSADIWSVGVLLTELFFDYNAIHEIAHEYSDVSGDHDPTLFRAITQVVGNPTAKLMQAYDYASNGRCLKPNSSSARPDTYLDLEKTLLTPDSVAFFKHFYTNKQYLAILDLIHACLRFDPRERITFADVQKHPLFAVGTGCDGCACETVRGYHMPDNTLHPLPPNVERLIHDMDETPALVRYARELFKRVELAQPERRRYDATACACVSIASKLLHVDKMVRLHRALMLHASGTTLADMKQLDPATRTRKWNDMAELLHQLEGVCGQLVEWNFDGPWHATAQSEREENDILAHEKRAFLSMYKDEAEHRMDATYMTVERQPELTIAMRDKQVDVLVSVHRRARLCPQTLFVAIKALDSFLAKQVVRQDTLSLTSYAALFFASARQDTDPIDADTMLTLVCGSAFTRDELIAKKDMFDSAGLDLVAPVVLEFMQPLARLHRVKLDTQVWHLAVYLAELTLQSYSMLAFAPSHMAAAAFYLATDTVSLKPLAPIGCSLKDILPCMRQLYALILATQASNCIYTAITDKYANRKLGGVSKLSVRKPAVLS
jgi:serine/threonine protein kinase